MFQADLDGITAKLCRPNVCNDGGGPELVSSSRQLLH